MTPRRWACLGAAYLVLQVLAIPVIAVLSPYVFGELLPRLAVAVGR